MDELGDSVERWEFVDQNDRTNLFRAEHELEDLRIDLDSTVSSLPDNLRFVATQLQERSITEISQQFRIPRSSLYNSIKRLRNMLEKAGICDYLSNS